MKERGAYPPPHKGLCLPRYIRRCYGVLVTTRSALIVYTTRTLNHTRIDFGRPDLLVKGADFSAHHKRSSEASWLSANTLGALDTGR
jgi:hypothetical protein